MRHQVAGRRLSRTSAHRKALFRNLVTSLFEHERIKTTVHKAKELRGVAEKLITIARTDTLAARRRVRQTVQKREIFNKLFSEIAPRFKDRPGGYTRVIRTANRPGDNAEMAIIELVVTKEDITVKEEGKKKTRKKAVTKEKKATAASKKKEAAGEKDKKEKPKTAAKKPTAKAEKVTKTKAAKTDSAKAETKAAKRKKK